MMNIKMKVIRLIHRGTGGQQGWIYSTDGLLSTLPASSYKDPPKIVVSEVDNKTEISKEGCQF